MLPYEVRIQKVFQVEVNRFATLEEARTVFEDRKAKPQPDDFGIEIVYAYAPYTKIERG